MQSRRVACKFLKRTYRLSRGSRSVNREEREYITTIQFIRIYWRRDPSTQLLPISLPRVHPDTASVMTRVARIRRTGVGSQGNMQYDQYNIQDLFHFPGSTFYSRLVPRVPLAVVQSEQEHVGRVKVKFCSSARLASDHRRNTTHFQSGDRRFPGHCEYHQSMSERQLLPCSSHFGER